ncbi:GntR family transcriptional regulator [Subtercola vilae]|uniref:GntR family transcriptional regulator n=2 Tax=Microbacteriaceae TaxID=85023 RepID=A0A4T2BT58_9MICO|nr:GntR family transcriptional regulator [Subtercola vilae]
MDARSAATASDQLRVLVLTDVRSGTLAPGAALPPVRRLAEQLGLAPNTVAKVYRELERDGVLVTRGRGGTSVAPTGDGPQRQAQVAALEYARRVRELGLGDDAALATIAEALRAV